MIDLARERGMSVLNAAPYAGGALAKGADAYGRYVYQEATEAMLDPIRRVEAICARHDTPTGAAALGLSLDDPRIASTLVGVSTPEHVERTIEWSSAEIPAALREELSAFPVSKDDPEATLEYKLG